MQSLIESAANEAIYNLYMYLAGKIVHISHEPLYLAADRLADALSSHSEVKRRDISRLEILQNAIKSNPTLANSVISNLTLSHQGLNAGVFTRSDKSVSVVFMGTGSGEWIDNGEGLSGIPEENIYLAFKKDGNSVQISVKNDYASTQQVEALNWFRRIYLKNAWSPQTKITLSGHSKGGNKAQFVAMHSPSVKSCFSFNGQGFSPEAIVSLKRQFYADFDARRSHIYGFCANNDYVSALGMRLIKEDNIFYLKPRAGIHFMEAILEKNGALRPFAGKGKLFSYIETVSEDLMRMNPSVRQLATLGVMNVCQKYLGSGTPVNGDSVSAEITIAGIGIAISQLLRQLGNSMEG